MPSVVYTYIRKKNKCKKTLCKILRHCERLYQLMFHKCKLLSIWTFRGSNFWTLRKQLYLTKFLQNFVLKIGEFPWMWAVLLYLNKTIEWIDFIWRNKKILGNNLICFIWNKPSAMFRRPKSLTFSSCFSDLILPLQLLLSFPSVHFKLLTRLNFLLWWTGWSGCFELF